MATFDEPITSRYLAYLDQWREHRGFRLEERVSVFFAWLLPHVIQVEANVGSTNLIVIPEFPLYHGAIKEGGDETFRYDAVDFAVFAPMEKRAFLVELKTDMGSFTDDQQTTLAKARRSLSALIGWIARHCQSGPTMHRKLRVLIDNLEQAGLISRERQDIRYSKDEIRSVCSQCEDGEWSLDVYYVIPEKRPLNYDFEVIDFGRFAEIIDGHDAFATSFAGYLRKWTEGPGQ